MRQKELKELFGIDESKELIIDPLKPRYYARLSGESDTMLDACHSSEEAISKLVSSLGSDTDRDEIVEYFELLEDAAPRIMSELAVRLGMPEQHQRRFADALAGMVSEIVTPMREIDENLPCAAHDMQVVTFGIAAKKRAKFDQEQHCLNGVTNIE